MRYRCAILTQGAVGDRCSCHGDSCVAFTESRPSFADFEVCEASLAARSRLLSSRAFITPWSGLRVMKPRDVMRCGDGNLSSGSCVDSAAKFSVVVFSRISSRPSSPLPQAAAKIFYVLTYWSFGGVGLLVVPFLSPLSSELPISASCRLISTYCAVQPQILVVMFNYCRNACLHAFPPHANVRGVLHASIIWSRLFPEGLDKFGGWRAKSNTRT